MSACPPKETATVTAAVAVVPAPLSHFAAQGPPPGIPRDSALEVVSQLELMNLIDSSSISDAMRAVWSTDLAKKYLHLPWVLLNEPFEVEAVTAANVALSAPMALQILGPATPINKLLLEGQPSLPAVDAVYRAVEQASRIAQPAPAIATLPPMMTTSAQMLSVIAQQQPSAATTNSPSVAANAFGETLCAINDDLSIMEASPFPTATAPLSPKIDVLLEVHPCGGLVLNFPGEEPISSDSNDKE
uniref:Uncharacterized protein n=1 Tax=Romanomermis culicivorax TaxID=13658 RepID=A0A915L1I1_ROMCU